MTQDQLSALKEFIRATAKEEAAAVMSEGIMLTRAIIFDAESAEDDFDIAFTNEEKK